MAGLKIVGLGGSLRASSRSRAALAVALDGAAAAGAAVELLDLRRLDLPIFSPELEAHAPASVFGDSGAVQDEMIELQLRTLGEEVVRVAERFAHDPTLHRSAECQCASERVAQAA